MNRALWRYIGGENATSPVEKIWKRADNRTASENIKSLFHPMFTRVRARLASWAKA